MQAHIALLRGVNVGGNRMVAMADLRALLVQLGFEQVRSLSQSGNLVFQDDARSCDQIETLLETETRKRLDLTTEFFVRTDEQLKEIIANNPFGDEADTDPAHLVAMFLKREPHAQQVAALTSAIAGRERISVKGRLAYVVYPDGIGRSKLTQSLVDRKLETRGTARNWNTVMKLSAMMIK